MQFPSKACNVDMLLKSSHATARHVMSGKVQTVGWIDVTMHWYYCFGLI